MANYDDALTAAQKRAMRTGRSFFPAANAQGQTIQFSGAGSGGFRALPPDQNPAYQAAIAKNPTPASRYAAAKATPTSIGTYQGMYGPDTVVSTGPNAFRTYSSQGGYIGRTGNAADYLSRQQPVATTPTPVAPSYGSQVGFSMLSNVPSAPSVPSVTARPYEAPPAPFTTSEKIGSTIALANPLRAIPPITSALTSFGRGAFGIGRDIYGGFTGNRAAQPPPSEMGAGSTPTENPPYQNPWGNTSVWTRGLGRYFD